MSKRQLPRLRKIALTFICPWIQAEAKDESMRSGPLDHVYQQYLQGRDTYIFHLKRKRVLGCTSPFMLQPPNHIEINILHDIICPSSFA